MPDRDRSKIQKALRNKGFVETEGTKHDIFTLVIDGKYTQIGTFFSRGSDYKSYGTTLLGQMKNQLKISMAELLELIDCKLKYPEYISILKKKKIIP
jgi:uncharacterized protein (DUF39 family)